MRTARIALTTTVLAVSLVSSGPAEASTSVASHGIRATLTCSSPLKLYDGTYLTGSEVSVSARGLWIDLSTVSFDNRTSSFKVGACSVDLASGAGGSGAHYTRCLSAGCEEDVMDLGWNNVVSSVYLH
jgi:hypothetical protein